MPISCKRLIRQLSQQEFGDIAYEVMGHISLLRDWGVGLDISLYEAAIRRHFDPQDLLAKSQIRAADGRLLGVQAVQQIAHDTAIRLTAVSQESLLAFEHHLRQFFRHTSLRVLQWVNLTRQAVQFKTII